MNIVITILTLALSLLQQVQANPNASSELRAQSIAVAEEAIQIATNYELANSPITNSASIPMNSSDSQTALQPAPKFTEEPIVTVVSPNTFDISWKSDIPATGELRVFSSSAQIQEWWAKNYEAGDIQGTSNLGTDGTIRITIGGVVKYAVIIRANGQSAADAGTIVQ